MALFFTHFSSIALFIFFFAPYIMFLMTHYFVSFDITG